MGDFKTCGRCGGSGRYAYNLKDGSRCYGCGGTGKVPTVPAGTAKSMKIICVTDDWVRFTFKNGEELKAKFCNLSDKTQEPIYMVSNKFGTGFKMKLSAIEKHCRII